MAKIKVTKFNGTDKELNKIRNGVKNLLGIFDDDSIANAELEKLKKMKSFETYWIDTDHIYAVSDNITEGVDDYPSRYAIYFSPNVEDGKNIWNITADSYEELMKAWKK